MGYCDRGVKAINHLNYFCSRALIFQLIGTFELQNFSELKKPLIVSFLPCQVRDISYFSRNNPDNILFPKRDEIMSRQIIISTLVTAGRLVVHVISWK